MDKIQAHLDSIPGLGKFNMKVLEITANRVQLQLPLEGNTNHLGTMYAGALYSAAEFPFGLLYLHHFQGQPMVPVIGEMSIRYLAPVTGDATVVLEVSDDEWADMAEGTKTTGKFKFKRDLEVHDENGTVVCRTSATYFSISTG